MSSLLRVSGLATAVLSLGLASCVTVTIDKPGRGGSQAPPPAETSAMPLPEAPVAPDATTAPLIPQLDESKPWYRHTVVGGDSIWKLSKDYQTTMGDIRAANGIEGDRIVAGETIFIPTNNPPEGAVEVPKPEPAPSTVPTPAPVSGPSPTTAPTGGAPAGIFD